METIEYYEDEEEPSLTGWYIIYRDEGEETNYDAIGPYDSREQATEVMQGEMEWKTKPGGAGMVG